MGRRAVLVIFVALCAVAAAASPPARSVVPEHPPPKVAMPDVVGMRVDRATRLLHSRGLRVDAECRGRPGCVARPSWRVCRQSPRAGRKVRKGSAVVIVGSRPGGC